MDESDEQQVTTSKLSEATALKCLGWLLVRVVCTDNSRSVHFVLAPPTGVDVKRHRDLARTLEFRIIARDWVVQHNEIRQRLIAARSIHGGEAYDGT